MSKTSHKSHISHNRITMRFVLISKVAHKSHNSLFFRQKVVSGLLFLRQNQHHTVAWGPVDSLGHVKPLAPDFNFSC